MEVDKHDMDDEYRQEMTGKYWPETAEVLVNRAWQTASGGGYVRRDATN